MNTIYKDLIIALVLASIGAAAAWTVQGWRLDKVRAEYAAFVAETRAAGEAAQKAVAMKEAADQQRKEQADRENSTTIAGLRADIKRLRHDNDAARSPVPPAAPGARRPDLACFDRAELESALRGFLAEARAIADQGSEAIVNLNTAKAWAQRGP